MYAQVNGSDFVRWVSLKTDFPNVSFPAEPTEASLPDGIVLVRRKNPEAPAEFGYMWEHSGTPVLDNGVWVLRPEKKLLPQAVMVQQAEDTAETVRARRNQLLSASDWTQVRDAPEAVSALWAPYRQALRNLPEQDGFPYNVTWPVAPDAPTQPV